MEIHTAFSYTHAPLAALWQPSLQQSEPSATCVVHRLGVQNFSIYQPTVDQTELRRALVDLHLSAAERAQGSIIGFTHADVVFRRPFIDQIIFAMHPAGAENDALFLRGSGDLIDSAVMFYRCTPKLLWALEHWRGLMPQWNGSALERNRLLRLAFDGLRWDVLPAGFASEADGDGDLNDRAVVAVHASSGDIAHKRGLMERWFPAEEKVHF